MLLSAIVVLLACGPLYDALRRCGRRRWAPALLAPLALGSLQQLAYVGAYAWVHVVANFNWSFEDHPLHLHYFDPVTLAKGLASPDWTGLRRGFDFELLKWSACVAIERRTGPRDRPAGCGEIYLDWVACCARSYAATSSRCLG